MRTRDGGGLRDRFVSDEGVFDLERTDPVAGGEDDVVRAPLEEEALVVVAREIAGP